jgi:hypothetical protein
MARIRLRESRGLLLLATLVAGLPVTILGLWVLGDELLSKQPLEWIWGTTSALITGLVVLAFFRLRSAAWLNILFIAGLLGWGVQDALRHGTLVTNPLEGLYVLQALLLLLAAWPAAFHASAQLAGKMPGHAWWTRLLAREELDNRRVGKWHRCARITLLSVAMFANALWCGGTLLFSNFLGFSLAEMILGIVLLLNCYMVAAALWWPRLAAAGAVGLTAAYFALYLTKLHMDGNMHSADRVEYLVPLGILLLILVVAALHWKKVGAGSRDAGDSALSAGL